MFPSRPSRRQRHVLVGSSIGAALAAIAVLGVVSGTKPDLGRVGVDERRLTRATTVPSIFAHTRDSATAMLEERGLKVRYAEQASCDPVGRPLETKPATGAAVEVGDTVTLVLAVEGATMDCAVDLREHWEFIDFATGRGPSPHFADTVTLFVDGDQTATLSASEAARGEWGDHSALRALSRASDEVVRVGKAVRTPTLHVLQGTPPDSWCGKVRPREVAAREALSLMIEVIEPETQQQCPARVALYQTNSAIDAVVLWTDSATPVDLAPLPSVVGLALDKARGMVTAAGYTVKVAQEQTCHPRDGVVEQAPTPPDLTADLTSDREDDGNAFPTWTGPVTLVAEIAHRTRECASLDAAASAFIRFARGGAPPRWAPQVRQLLGYTTWATVSAAEANNLGTWSLCSGVAPQKCAASAVAVIARGGEIATGEDVDVARVPGDQFCDFIDRGGLPTELLGGQQIVLFPARPASCDEDWSVRLWVDDTGRITAVNLLVPAA